jgi:hypothetical protein
MTSWKCWSIGNTAGDGGPWRWQTQILPGTHWIAILIDPRRHREEYFDSFGRPPDEHFNNFINAHCSDWMYNKRQLQSVVSKYCGYYCVVYCLLKSMGKDMNSFIKVFSRDTGYNDVLIKKCLRLIVDKQFSNNAMLSKFTRWCLYAYPSPRPTNLMRICHLLVLSLINNETKRNYIGVVDFINEL